jgi:hypothetical protein
MSEFLSRLRAARYALRGDSVLRGVKIRNGTVEVPGSLHLFGDSELTGNEILVPRPVVFRVSPGAVFEDNTGDGIGRVERARS